MGTRAQIPNQIKVQATSITMVPTKELTPNPVNRNKHPKKQIENLAKQYEYQGMRNQIVVSNQSGLVVAGNGRLLAAKKAGLEEIPVSFQDFVSAEQEYAYGIADNGTAIWSDLDYVAINADLQELGPDFDIDMLGIADFELDFDKSNAQPSKDKSKNKLTFLECPHCKEQFEQSQATVISESSTKKNKL